jgi:glycerophosphoryl diester phosphodiesterase
LWAFLQQAFCQNRLENIKTKTMNRKIFYFISLVVFSMLPVNSLSARNIEIAVHRGANRQAPENTMSAAIKAIELGGDYLEVDVRKSKDGIYYNFHDNSLDRTTNGTGNFMDFSSSELEQLDAGSWFRHSFRGEKIPTIEKQIMELGDKIKFYFDFKSGDIQEFIGLVKQWGVAESCFFNPRGNYNETDLEALSKAGIAFKLNIKSIAELNELYAKWQPPIIEVVPQDLSHELVNAAHDKGVKVKVYIPGDQYELYLHSLKFDIDMVNIDNPDVFMYILENNELPPFSWIAHRGTIVNHNFREYQPDGIKEVFKRSYAGVEIDIWKSSDDQLVVHHDRDLKQFFGVDKNIDEMTLGEIKTYTSLKGNFKVMSLDEYLELVPSDAVLMLDLKSRDRTDIYYKKIRESVTRRHSLDQTIFIDRDARNHFWGEARFSVRVAEMPDIIEKWRNGEDVACHYFLFDHGNVLSAQWVRFAQAMSIEVIPSVNIFHYRAENFLFGGLRDIEYLKRLGVGLYQIDAVYEENLIKESARND